MYTSSHRFGDTRGRQSRPQKQRGSEPGSGKRRRDPAIHATSRPWHTSAPGIKMNVSTLSQIANRDPVAARYLNQMKLSEMAQKKRGIGERDEGRGIDKMGRAIKAGTVHAQGRGKMPGAPNADRIAQWQADLMGRERAVKKSTEATDELPGAQANVDYRQRRVRDTGRIARDAQANVMAARNPPIDVFGRAPRPNLGGVMRAGRTHVHALANVERADRNLTGARNRVSSYQSDIARGARFMDHVSATTGLKKKLPIQKFSYRGDSNPYF